jgi:hypothetical protein
VYRRLPSGLLHRLDPWIKPNASQSSKKQGVGLPTIFLFKHEMSTLSMISVVDCVEFEPASAIVANFGQAPSLRYREAT